MPAAAVLAGRRATAASVSAAGLGRRSMDWAVRVVLAFALVSSLSLLLGLAVGYRALVVRSGSMAPSFRAGDVVVTHVARPDEVEVGDVVTFRDPSRDQQLVTHRVRELSRDGSSFSFVTGGDANTGVERWSIGDGGNLGRFRFHIPGAGYAVGWLATAAVKVALIVGAALALAAAAIRRIWA